MKSVAVITALLVAVSVTFAQHQPKPTSKAAPSPIKTPVARSAPHATVSKATAPTTAKIKLAPKVTINNGEAKPNSSRENQKKTAATTVTGNAGKAYTGPGKPVTITVSTSATATDSKGQKS